MSTTRRVYPGNFLSLYKPNFFDSHSLALPSNKTISVTPVNFEPDSKYINGGVTTLSFNTGQGIPDLSYDKISYFVENPDFIKNSVGGSKPLFQFTQQDCINAVNGFCAARGNKLKIVTTGASENNVSNIQWTQSYIDIGDPANPNEFKRGVPQQYHWIDQAWVANLNSNGRTGNYFGDYDGHGACMKPINEGNSEALRAGFQSNSGAWNYMSQHTPFGNPFFTGNAYTYRDGLVKTYWDGAISARDRIFAMSADLLLSKKALAFKNSTKKIMSFCFPGKSEFINRSELYRRELTGSQTGVVTAFGFPQYSHRAQVIIGYISLAIADALYLWEDTNRWGNDPNVVWDSTFEYSYTGGTAPRVGSQYLYNPTAQAPYYNMPYIGHNAILTGAEFYSKACQWAGQNVSYAGYKTVSGDFSETGPDYLLNSYQRLEPVGYLHQSGNKRALFCYDHGLKAGESRTWIWNLNSELSGVTDTFTLTMEGCVPYLFLFELTVGA